MELRDKLNNHIVRERLKFGLLSLDSEKPSNTIRENQRHTSHTPNVWNIKIISDEDSNSVDIILVASALYYILSIGGALSILLIMWRPESTPFTWIPEDALVALVTLILLFLTIWPVAKLGGLGRYALPEEDNVIRLSERVGVTILIPLSGGMIGAWNVFSGLFRPFIIAIFVSVFTHMWMAQNGTESNISERFQHMISNMWIIPIWISIGGFVLLRQTTEVPVEFFLWPAILLPVLGVFVLSYAWLHRNKDHLQIQKVKITPIEDESLRRTLFVLQWSIVFLHFLLLVFITIEILDYFNMYDTSSAGSFSTSFRTLEELFVVFPWSARLTLIGYLLLVMLPIIILLVMWVHNLTSEFSSRRTILKKAEEVPAEQLGFTPDVPVLRTELGRPEAMLVPIWHERRSVVVFDRKMTEKLEPPHLEALYYHEYYHLMRGHEWKIDILRVIGPLVGGINATLTYWFPSISDNRADCYAAYRTDKTTISQAIVEMHSMSLKHNIVDSIGDSEDSNTADSGSGDSIRRGSAQSCVADFRRAYRETQSFMYGSILRGAGTDTRIELLESECAPDEFDDS